MNHQFEIQFSEPDTYGEIHARLEIPLCIEQTQTYLNLSINGAPAERYFFTYNDAGTVGYARMQGQYAIDGQLTNVSDDCGNVLNVVGTIDKGKAVLQIWKKVADTPLSLMRQ